MLNRRARKIIGYDALVKKLAVTIPEEDMEYIEIVKLQKMLGAGYERWEFKDWHRLIVDIRKEQQKEVHESITTQYIFDELPYAVQQAAQEAVLILIKKASKNLLFKLDETADATVNILWNMFYCMGIDIMDTAKELHEKHFVYSCDDLRDNKLLYDFIDLLRRRQWYRQGEVARLRTRTK